MPKWEPSRYGYLEGNAYPVGASVGSVRHPRVPMSVVLNIYSK